MVDKNGDKFGEYVMKVDDEYAKYTRLRFLTQFGLVVVGGGPIFAHERPKRAKMAQKWPKSDFDHSAGGPKRLEWRGTKLEQVTGASRDFENLDIIFENLDIIFENGI